MIIRMIIRTFGLSFRWLRCKGFHTRNPFFYAQIRMQGVLVDGRGRTVDRGKRTGEMGRSVFNKQPPTPTGYGVPGQDSKGSRGEQ